MSNTDFSLPGGGWKPYKFQVKAWNEMVKADFRRAYLCWPRRHGKDSVAGHITAVKAMQRVGNYAIMLPQVNQVRRALWDGLNHNGIPRIDEFFPPEIVTKRDGQSMMLWLASGSTVQLLGSDSYQSSIGSGFTGIVYSEAALTTLEASQFLRPMIEFNKGYEIFISTPRGRNHFYRGLNGAFEDMRNGVPGIYAEHINAENAGLFKPSDLTRIRLDYIRDMGQTMGQATFDQEYMTSFTASLVGSVYGAELDEMEFEGRVGSFPYIRGQGVMTAWDLGVADATSILFFTNNNGRYRLIDAYEGTGIGLDSYIEVLREKKQKYGYNYVTHYAPHDIQVREFATGTSRIEQARRMGLNFTRTPQTRIKTQVSVTAQLLRNLEINSDNPDVMEALDHFKQYRWQVNKSNGMLMEQPMHDEHSHAASALATMAVNAAKSLGGMHYRDPDLHGEAADLGGHAKWDPRMYGNAPYSHENSVSNLMRGRVASGTAFG